MLCLMVLHLVCLFDVQFGEKFAVGRERVRRTHKESLGLLRSRDYRNEPAGAVRRPVVIGEIGIAFDYEREDGALGSKPDSLAPLPIVPVSQLVGR